MHIKVIASEDGGIPRALQFGTKTFKPDDILALAGETRSPLNKALVLKALLKQLISLDALCKKHKHISQRLLAEWDKDLEVLPYLSSDGHVIVKEYAMSTLQQQSTQKRKLVPRIKTVPAFNYTTVPEKVVCGAWELDVHGHRLWYGEKTERLKRQHTQILFILMRERNQTVLYADICRPLNTFAPDAHLYLAKAIPILQQTIWRLGGKVKQIEHLAGTGYRFNA